MSAFSSLIRYVFAAGALGAGAVLLSFLGCSQQWLVEENERLKSEIESLRKEIVLIRARNEDLVRSQPGLTKAERDEYRKRGLKEPREAILADLGGREELMPLKGIFGARPSFYSDSRMYILNSRWVFTSWNIGGQTGQQLFEYTIGQNGEIRWKIIDTLIK